jgi:hypothetical protein
MSETRGASPAGRKKKQRRLSFADEMGRSISEVEYCDNLHYSDPAQQVSYDADGNQSQGANGGNQPKPSASCCVIS